MKLNQIHDIQTAYRKVLYSMSRPGVICDISDEAANVDIETGCSAAIIVLVLMLLDTEVTFKVFSKRETEMSRLISQLTYAKSASVEQADFIICLEDREGFDLETAINESKAGNLMDPQKSATLLVEAKSISNTRDLIVKGPGIESETAVSVNINEMWVENLRLKNIEYPLGADVIFIDREHRILCLPRTTQIAIAK